MENLPPPLSSSPSSPSLPPPSPYQSPVSPTFTAPEMNPYAPPRAELDVRMAEVDLADAYETASKGKRFLNYVIDRVTIYAGIIGLAYIIGTLEGLGYVDGFSLWLEEMSGLTDMALTALLSVLYYAGMEMLWGRTLGKIITGTKVISTAGTKPGFLAILGRSLARYVPFEPFSMLGSAAWHDSWSGTQVIDLRRKNTTARTRPYFR